MSKTFKELPADELSGRLAFTVSKFVDKKDIFEKCILDIGCGFGWFEFWALRHHTKAIHGIELEEEKLTKLKSIKDKRLKYKTGSAINIPYPANSFDTVTSWDVIEHIPPHTEAKMFHEVGRVLKPGGIFYLSTPNAHWISKLLDPAWWLIAHRHYTLGYFQKLAKNTGFRIQKHVIKGKIWELLTIINLYISKWLLKRPLLFSAYFAQHRDWEYRQKDGFALIFLKFKKKK